LERPHSQGGLSTGPRTMEGMEPPLNALREGWVRGDGRSYGTGTPLADPIRFASG